LARDTRISLFELFTSPPSSSTVWEDFLNGEGQFFPPDQTKTATQTISLGQGDYLITATADVVTRLDEIDLEYYPVDTNPSPPARISWELEIKFRDGQSQDDAFLPLPDPQGGWRFSGVPGGRWFDPVPADGFEFEMLSEGSFFTEAGMPVGLGDPNGYLLTYLDGANPVSVNVAGGATHNFPAGVTSFKVLDIDPSFDPDDPLAFPIFLDFSTPTASFTMTPILVPEPASLVLLALGGLLLARRLEEL
jgi:hypothetical protein